MDGTLTTPNDSVVVKVVYDTTGFPAIKEADDPTFPGYKTYIGYIFVNARNALGVDAANTSFTYTDPTTPTIKPDPLLDGNYIKVNMTMVQPHISVDKATFSRKVSQGDTNVTADTLQIWNRWDNSILKYSLAVNYLTSQVDWITVSDSDPSHDSNGATDKNTLTIKYDISQLTAGTHQAEVVVNSDNASNSPLKIQINLSVEGTFINVVSPNGGEILEAGSTNQVTWNSNVGGVVNIDLWKSDALNSRIASNVSNANSTNSYNWTIPTTLSGSTFKIRITSINITGIESSSYKPFTITSMSSKLALSYPYGGEYILAGSSTVTWNTTAASTDTVKIELYQSDVLNSTIAPAAPNSGSFTWTVPAAANLKGNTFKVRLTLNSDGVSTSQSASTFTINELYLMLTVPDGGESWAQGETKQILWKTNIPSTEKLNLTLLDSGATVATIGDSISNTGYYNWTIPTTYSGSNYKVKIIRVSDNSFNDTSSAVFSIYAPAVTVVAPNGGESWSAGLTKRIKWTSNSVAKIRLELLKNDLSQFIIVDDLENVGYYDWLVPPTQTVGTDYKIKVTLKSATYVTDVSDANFTIPESIVVTSPAGGEIWAVSTSRALAWTTNAKKGTVRIDLLKGGVWLSTIVSDAANEGSYAWEIPTTLVEGADYQIRATDNVDGTLTNTGAAFTIQTTPSISVQSPKGGEIYTYGSRQTIAWTSNAGGTVSLELYSDGTLVDSIATGVDNTAYNSSYTWTIDPVAAMVGTKMRIKITATSCSAQSAADFTIQPGNYILLSSPVGGELWKPNTTNQIIWQSNIAGKVRIEYSADSGATFTTIIDDADNSGTYTYNWATAVATGDHYRIRIRSKSVDLFDLSPADFAIRDMYIELASPNGGEMWETGVAHAINWSTNVDGTVNISLLKAGSVISSIAKSAPNSGTYSWTIPSTTTEGADYKVTVTSNEYSTVGDTSAATFTIGKVIHTLISPNGGEIWSPGTTQTIKWSSNDGSTVNITLLKDDVAVSTIATGAPNSGSYSWAIPASTVLGTGYKVRVVGLTKTAESAKSFSMVTKTLQLTSPNGGEKWGLGTTQTIKWSASLDGTVSIDLLKAGSVVSTLSSAVAASDGSLSWAIPKDFTVGTDYRVQVTSSAYSMTDQSDGDFSLLLAPVIATSSTSLSQVCVVGSDAASLELNVWNAGDGTLNFTESDNADWLSVTPTSGTSSSTSEIVKLTISFKTSTLTVGEYQGIITIIDSNATNSPYTVTVALTVVKDALPSTGLVSWLALSGSSNTTKSVGTYIYKDAKGKVSRWIDLSGQKNNAMQNVSSKKPEYVAKGLGTLPALQFAGPSRLMFPAKAKGITGGAPFKTKTIGIVFKTGTSFSSRQMVYEQGSQKHGINIYVDTDSALYLNAWNLANDSGVKSWGPVYAKTTVSVNTLYFVELVYDQPNGKLLGYLNGVEIGPATGLGILANDTGPGVIGGVYQKTYCHDGVLKVFWIYGVYCGVHVLQ